MKHILLGFGAFPDSNVMSLNSLQCSLTPVGDLLYWCDAVTIPSTYPTQCDVVWSEASNDTTIDASATLPLGVGNVTLVACMALCVSNPSCVAITYHSPTGSCYYAPSPNYLNTTGTSSGWTLYGVLSRTCKFRSLPCGCSLCVCVYLQCSDGVNIEHATCSILQHTTYMYHETTCNDDHTARNFCPCVIKFRK